MKDLATVTEADAKESALWMRIRRLHGAFAVHAGLFGDANPLAGIGQRLGEIEAWWARLVASAGQARSPLADQIDVLVKEVEHEVLETDARIEMAAFRLVFDESKMTFEQAYVYAQLLAVDITGHASRRDRVEFLVARMLSKASADGPVAISWEEAAATLEGLSSHRATEESGRSAVKFFHEAMSRLEQCTDVDEVFDSGLLLDLQGYKRALGADLLDPRILYSSTLLNNSITRRLRFLVGLEGLPPAALAVRYQKLDQKLREIFRDTRVFHSPVAARYGALQEQATKRLTLAPRARQLDPIPSVPTARRILRLLGALVILAGGGAGARDAWLRRDTLEPLSRSEVERLSPHLATASIARRPDEPAVLVGTVRVEWNLLSLDERRRASRELRDALEERGVRAALIMDAEQRDLVVQIDEFGAMVVE